MPMGTERSKSLHNFTLPCDLRWGNQRFLRCMKVNTGSQITFNVRADGNSFGSADRHHHHHLPIQQRRAAMDRGRDSDSFLRLAEGSSCAGRTHPLWAAVSDGSRKFGCDDGGSGGIAATREKLMLDLQTAADKMKNAFFMDGGLDKSEVPDSMPLPPPPPATAAAPAEGVIHRPWNLRKRRASGRTPPTTFTVSAGGGNSATGVKGFRVDAAILNPGSSQTRSPAETATQKSPIHPNGGEAASSDKVRAKFSVALSKREIEEDFLSVAGHRLPRRPKKRPRTIQKQLDTLFPGLWLTEVNPDMYKVPEAAL